ncbi:uncharacterized protein LOC142923458 [Petromyzon marinus]|uniref:uncharacterized protein LOC142923458 n=2 Tax=Petromyzon marinus TaxID=7757 RepID=UPI003F730E3C
MFPPRICGSIPWCSGFPLANKIFIHGGPQSLDSYWRQFTEQLKLPSSLCALPAGLISLKDPAFSTMPILLSQQKKERKHRLNGTKCCILPLEWDCFQWRISVYPKKYSALSQEDDSSSRVESCTVELDREMKLRPIEARQQDTTSTQMEHPEGAEIEARGEDIANTHMEHPEGAETRPEDIVSTQTDHPEGVESEERRQGIASTQTEHPEGAEIESRGENIANSQMEYPEGAETRPEDIASTQTDHPGVESEEKRQGIASTGTEHPEGAEIESREEDIANTQMEHSEGAETRLEDIASTQTEHPEEVESKSRPPEQSDTDLALHTKGRHDLVWQRHQKMQVMFENILPQGYAITQRCSLNQEEDEFWKSMISDYLKPLEEDDDHRKRVKQELFEIRNKGTFVYFMINALWLVATLALQFVGARPLHPDPEHEERGDGHRRAAPRLHVPHHLLQHAHCPVPGHAVPQVRRRGGGRPMRGHRGCVCMPTQ